ncbi:MAG TPA: hypothetical protein VJR47_16350 [Stellaceae bacterium]|nr:hypothetical protein [Stellaceae bacterium]
MESANISITTLRAAKFIQQSSNDDFADQLLAVATGIHLLGNSDDYLGATVKRRQRL